MTAVSLPFALYFQPDGYSMAGKIMGRQAAGHALLKAAAAYEDSEVLHATGPHPDQQNMLRAMLDEFGSSVQVHWHTLHRPESLGDLGALYYPAPPTRAAAALRNNVRSAAYSVFGVTHTLSSDGAMALLADLALPPFKPWDALICTSRVTRDVFEQLKMRTREAFARETGAVRFPDVQAPIIPLGIVTKDFAPDEKLRAMARQECGLDADSIMILSLGRLTFHAKYNPAPLYRALETLPPAVKARLLLVECGVYPNDGIAKAYSQAQAALMPSVRCIQADGANARLRAGLWRAADLFVSLSDNIQETFGLSPIEAMAAGLPVIATDWNGYRDTVRHGVDGFLIPTLSAPPGTGGDLARRYAVGADSYDMYIGRASLATACDHEVLEIALSRLIGDRDLRKRMGEAGRQRAVQDYDWAHILRRYAALCHDLAEIRLKAACDEPEEWPERPDPFSLFATYPSRCVALDDRVVVAPRVEERFAETARLTMANYGFHEECLPSSLLQRLVKAAARQDHWQAGDLMIAAGGDQAVATRSLLWLAKFGLCRIDPHKG